MAIDEEVLELVAKDGTMDYDKWPGLLEPIIQRLEHIVHNDFPTPKVPPQIHTSFMTALPIASSYSAQESNSQINNDKENAPPSQAQPAPFPSSTSSERIPDSQPQPGPTEGTLPPPLAAILSSIEFTLRSYFLQKPPHTIQRFAELVLRPTLHYRTLPAYLRAVDRVVSVSSGADIFPLPVSMPLPGGLIDSTLANGVNGVGSTGYSFSDSSLGSDESLGGALLTPIPWLNNSSLPGGNYGNLMECGAATNRILGAGSPTSDAMTIVPPRESGGVTQGELIRQEQEAGVIPTSHLNLQRQQPEPALAAGNEDMDTQADDSEEIPHARGPAILGVQDLGLQDGKGVEMTLTRSPTDITSSPAEAGADVPISEQTPAEAKLDNNEDAPGEPDRDGDGDIVIPDVSRKSNIEQEDDGLGSSSDSSTPKTLGREEADVKSPEDGSVDAPNDNDKMDQ
ncbi:hypothetical protein AJ80_01025 [Polytolypa hystricis UAMH7299]|uniref:Protein phosphatase 4 core regulatory subunit R2 n=1 Tax=Polytolypa hystricis (strain UAMH7299) TaxID=1447883 RepID=A0A2B7Z138_POLH7|nr:hypothetical protein AJ80_01025 [Polytolypa hystricis UAMH7299]